MGFTTAIDYSDRDASGHALVSKKYQLYKLRKWQARTRILTSVERNLAQAMNELDRLADLLNLPSYIREEAAKIYREAVEKGLVRGRSRYRARIRNHGHSCFLCEIVIRSQFHTTYEPEA
jgi:Transcription initiation factor IIB (TFIIB)